MPKEHHVAPPSYDELHEERDYKIRLTIREEFRGHPVGRPIVQAITQRVYVGSAVGAMLTQENDNSNIKVLTHGTPIDPIKFGETTYLVEIGQDKYVARKGDFTTFNPYPYDRRSNEPEQEKVWHTWLLTDLDQVTKIADDAASARMGAHLVSRHSVKDVKDEPDMQEFPR